MIEYGQWLKKAAIITSFCLTCTGAAIAQDNEEFPPEIFSPSTFGDLKSPLVWYSTSGGSTDRAYMDTVFGNFQRLTGVTLQSDFYPTMAQFWAGAQSGRIPWSLLMFDGSAAAVKSQQEGLLAPIDPENVPVDKLAGDYDTTHSVEGFIWGAVLTWNTNKWPSSGPHPSSMVDFYDVEKFPGKRCLYNGVQAGGVLESAVQAAGVPVSDVYPIDTKLAYEKLDTIREHVIWYNGGDDAVRFLVTGECDLGVTWSGRIYQAIHDDNAPLDMTWDGAVYASQFFSIPKDAPNPKAAEALLAMMILDRDAIREMAIRTSYMPNLVPPIELPDEVSRYVATPDKLNNAVREDGEFYANRLDELNQEFQAWMVR